jgi:2-keto-4-pentenoate hydratase/2-oxohepta-3-ene-1,7-dioic acid hydratase in catechol pathway
MRLVRFKLQDATPSVRVGVLSDDRVVDLNAAYQAKGSALGGMRQFLEEGEAALTFARTIVAGGSYSLPQSAVTLLAPIQDPEKIICVGMNYHDHCAEMRVSPPEVPMLFSKYASALSGPGDPIVWDTRETQELDPEVELVIVIGRRGQRIPLVRRAACEPQPFTIVPHCQHALHTGGRHVIHRRLHRRQ